MQRIDKEIKQLEHQKLVAEIQNLKKPWRRDKIQLFSLIGSIFTFLTVFITYLYLIFSGYFDQKKLELEIDKKTLTYENLMLSFEKDSLNKRKTQLHRELDSTIEFTALIKDKNNELLLQSDSIRSVLLTSISENQQKESELKRVYEINKNNYRDKIALIKKSGLDSIRMQELFVELYVKYVLSEINQMDKTAKELKIENDTLFIEGIILLKSKINYYKDNPNRKTKNEIDFTLYYWKIVILLRMELDEMNKHVKYPHNYSPHIVDSILGLEMKKILKKMK